MVSLLWQLSFHRLTMGKVKIGISVLLQIFWKKVLQKCFWSSPLPTIWILSKSLILIGCHGHQKAKFSKKNIQKSSSLHKLYFFIVVAHVLLLLWQLNFHILTIGKVEIGICFCVTADILTKVLLKCFWSSPLPILSKSLILIGGHGNRKAKFSRKKKIKKSSSLKPYSLHSCTFKWALWPMGLWFCCWKPVCESQFDIAM